MAFHKKINSGPPDKQVLVFRYQYLLIEVGAELLRKLYDDKKRLNKKFNKDLKRLLATNILNDDQKNLLPPLDKNPNAANYDITLLTCLLRSTCGLKPPQDRVWKTPANNDFTVEAEITRLRECRNFVGHLATVHISEPEFNQEWDKLCKILHRLNNFCGVPNLSDLINDASSKRLDDKLKTEHENTLKAWYDSDNLLLKRLDDLETGQSELKAGQSKIIGAVCDGQSQLKDGQSELKAGQSKIIGAVCDGQSQLKDGQSELKDGQSKIIGAVCDLNEQTNRRLDHVEQALDSNLASNSYTNDGIKECLRKSYEKHFRTVYVTPLYNEDDRMDMLTVYSRSKMIHVPYHRRRQKEGNNEISSYEQVFSNENSEFRNIFITGGAGMGKTSFGQFMSFLWSKAIAGVFVGNTKTQEDAKFMTNFDFVFYISLKETSREDVVSMIVDKYFSTSSRDKYTETIEQLLQNKKCLVILDGLDEWRPDIIGHRNLSLPIKVTSDKCTYLTTCRPHIIETVRLSEKDIDHQVQITGFDYKRYIEKVVCYINELQNSNKDPGDFMKQIENSRMVDQLPIPLLASQLIVVWIKYGISNMNRAMIYSSIVDMLFARAIKNKIAFPSMTSSDVHLPKPFSRFKHLQKHVCTLEKICLLSFLLLFDPDNETPSLVFTKDQLMSEPYNISSAEIDFLCQLGIISKNKVIAPFAEEKHMLSFLHTSYLEFLAALFVSLFAKTDFFREYAMKICICNVSKYENFLILLSGISPQKTKEFFDIIYEKDERDCRNCVLDFLINGKFKSHGDMQKLVLRCSKEICVLDNSQRFIELVYFTFSRHCEHRQYLKELFVFNKHRVKSLDAEYFLEEFNEVKGLQYLTIDMNVFDVKFNDVMLQNLSTLHSLILDECSLSSEIPVRSLPCLTSIRFERLTIKHDIYHDLMHYISGNILLENIVLRYVKCKEHDSVLSKCQFSLNLSKHSKLLQLDLEDTNIECSEINNSCILSLRRLKGRSYLGNCPGLTNVADIIQNSKLEYLNLDKDCIHDTEINHVINAISSLKYIKYIELYGFKIPDSAPLLIHPDIVCDECIYIKLQDVEMSDKSFQDFIGCVVHHQSVVRVSIDNFGKFLSNTDLYLWEERILSLMEFRCVRKSFFQKRYSADGVAEVSRNIVYEDGYFSIRISTRYWSGFQLVFKTKK